MEPESKHQDEEVAESDPELRDFIERLDSGQFDGHLFEEIRKLRAEHLAKVCRMIARRKFEDR